MGTATLTPLKYRTHRRESKDSQGQGVDGRIFMRRNCEPQTSYKYHNGFIVDFISLLRKHFLLFACGVLDVFLLNPTILLFFFFEKKKILTSVAGSQRSSVF